jgi:hypothetical protein
VSLNYPRGFDESYTKPLLHKVSIYDQSESNLLYQSNPFSPNNTNQNTLSVQGLEVNQQIWQTNDATVVVDSSSNGAQFDYPETIDCNAVMIIESGKTDSTKSKIFYGIIDAIEPLRFGIDGLRYNIYAKGFGVIPNHTFINFKKIAPPESLKPGAVIANNQNSDFFAHNLFRSVFEDQSIMPLLDYTLKERLGTGATLDEISNIVKDFIPGIRNPLVVASQVLNLIADMCGAIWYIDEEKRVVFKYPLGENSGIVIKDFYDQLDDGDYTSYILEPLSFVDSIRSEDGFAQRLFAVAEKSDIVGGGSAKYIAFSSLFNKDIAQAVIPGAAKFQNLSFVLSKTGAGTDAPNPLTAKLFGYIVTNGPNNTPGTELIATFSIPIKEIPTNPAPVYKLDINFRVNEININQLHWIVLQERGNEENNTIRWWHDDDILHVASPNHPRHSAIRRLEYGRSDGDPYSGVGWVVSHRGPVYSHAFATTANVLCEASDPLSIAKWGHNRPVEARVQAPLLKSVQATQQYLDLLVQLTAKKIRKYNEFVCTIPNNLIKTGTEVQVASDYLPALHISKNVIAQVQGVKYSFDATSNDESIGSRQCTVQLLSYISPLD